MKKIKKWLWSDLITWLRIHMVFDQWFNHTIFVVYFTGFISILFGNVPVNKIRQHLLDILLGLFRYNYVTNQWNKASTTCDLIQWINQGCIWYCECSTIIFYGLIFYRVDIRLICSWTSEEKQTLCVTFFTVLKIRSLYNKPMNKIRHYMLDN